MAALHTEPVDVMVYDDEASCREVIKRTLQKVYGVKRIETEDNIFSLRIDLAINRPKVLILDYVYAGGLNLPYVTPALKAFKGLGIIYSSVSRERVEKELGGLPPNFFFVEKGNLKLLRKVLDTALRR